MFPLLSGGRAKHRRVVQMSAFFTSNPMVGTKRREELRTSPLNNLASSKTGLGGGGEASKSFGSRIFRL